MNGLPYYKAYPRDFIEGTIGMPFELKATYRLVLDLIYMQSGDLPDDPRYIAGHLGCSVKKWNSLRADLIASGKIVVRGSFLCAKIADEWVAQARKDDARPAIPADVRNDVLAEGRCAYCGEETGPFEIDHIVPWSRGGSHGRHNLTLACRPCNRSKRALTPEEWLQ